MITADDVLTTCGRHPERLRWVSPAITDNAIETARRVSMLLILFGESRKLTSGFRDPETNRKTPGAAPQSRHLTGEAADIDDSNGTLKKWVLEHQKSIEQCGLWCEPLHMTPTWLHVQTAKTPNTERVPK